VRRLRGEDWYVCDACWKYWSMIAQNQDLAELEEESRMERRFGRRDMLA
jgi:hypothetical protein